MRIESQQMEVKNQNVKNKSHKGTDIFEILFSKNLKLENNENVKTTSEGKLFQISLKKLITLEQQIKDPEMKQELTSFVNKLLNENMLMKKTGEKQNIELINVEQLKQTLIKGNGDKTLEIPESKLGNLLNTLEKVSNIKNELKIPEVELQGIVKEVKKEIKIEQDITVTDVRLISSNNKQEKNQQIEGIQKPKTSEKNLLKIDDPFEELKKHRLEIQNVEGKVVSDIPQEINNWKVTNVKNDQMKISDWIDSFKQEIDRLTEFKIENNQKVSMMLKEQGEQLRIVVEKRESYIFVRADVTDNMRDKLNNILTEVQNEMKDKGVEVRLEIKDDKQDRNKENEEKNSREENNRNQQQGGAKDGRQHNQSND